MKNRAVLFFIISALFFSCEEGPVFVRDNPNDPASPFFIADSSFDGQAEIIQQLSLPYYVNDVVEITWNEWEFADYYDISITDSYGNKSFFRRVEKDQTIVYDTLKKGGRYMYEIKGVSGDISNYSFAEVDVSNFIRGTDKGMENHWWGVDVTALPDGKVLITNPSVNSRYKTWIYDILNNTVEEVPNPPNGSVSRTHLYDENSLIRLDESSYSFFNLNNYLWSNAKGILINGNPIGAFKSVMLNKESFLLIGINDSFFWIFDPSTGSLNSTEPANFRKQIFSMLRVSEHEVLKVGGDHDDDGESTSSAVEMFDLNSNSWTRLSDLSAGFVKPAIHMINNEHVLVLEGANSRNPTLEVLLYNFRTGVSSGIGSTVAGRPFTTRSPNTPFFSFILDNGDAIIVNGSFDHTYQIYDVSENILSDAISTLLDTERMIGRVTLTNGVIWLPTEREATYIFRNDSE